MNAALVLDAVRTPFGKYGGALSHIRPDDLAAATLRALLDRHPSLDPATVDDVVLGDANGAGEDNRNVARMAALLAQMPTSVTGATVNRLCGSGLQAAMDASRAIETGDAKVAVAGGVESMSRAPWVLLKPERGLPREHQTLHSTTLGWRMVNPLMPEHWTLSLGESCDLLGENYGISRDEQDAFALASHQNAAAAWESGAMTEEIVKIAGADLERDECIRADTSLEALGSLKPVFRKDGTVTAGNSSPLNDGAAMLLLGDESSADALGIQPLARIAGRAAAGVDPDVFGIGPVEAANNALGRAGIGWGDLSVVELNEAFAVQSLACLREWPDLDPAIVNVNGGAIAIGHPLGASGVRILGSLARELRRRGGRWGLAAICIGVGQGLAVVLEAA
ncbi:MAG TPA: thiolase family protein [Actinomycetota bacterium]|nr:thiolase family protein [Actinomycetota bacterium]